MTAALGVILDKGSNTQKFFGGGRADNKSKQTASDQNSHNNDVTAISISADRSFAASGQVGSSPVAFTWDACSGDKKSRYKLPKGSRGVNAISISQDGQHCALVDLNNDHYVHVFNVSDGGLVMKEKGDTAKIMDVCYSAKPGSKRFATAGSKHIKFWDSGSKDCQKGIYGGKGDATSHACVAMDNEDRAYTGGCNSKIYVWQAGGRELEKTWSTHKGGFICTIRWVNGTLVSGGKDGNVIVTDTATGNATATINFGGLVRAVDVNNGNLLVGLRSGDIYECSQDGNNKQLLMESHHEGEAWGLNSAGPDHVVTSCDDNKIKTWNIRTRKCECTGKISSESRKAPKGGASTLSHLPASQCARAVAVGPQGHVVVGHNDGTMTVRAGKDKLDQVISTNQDSKEWIEAIEFSPDGSMVAVGSHDNDIRVYSTSDWSLKGTLRAHKSFIVSVDWSKDGTFIRSVCGAHELLFFNVNEMKQDPSGASNTKGTEWATSHAKYGWSVEGIFPSGTDGTHINTVDWNQACTLIATGDDWGMVNYFRNPCRARGRPVSLRGHSEHVVRVLFHDNDSYLMSVGGYDQTLMQWKKK